MAYLVQSDLENAIGLQTVFALFSDGTAQVNAAAMADCLNRASYLVDSFIARVYAGPFPITQSPIPGMIRVAAIDFAASFAFERHPEYARSFGEDPRAKLWQRALDTMERICDALQEMPDFVAQPKQKTIGGVLYDKGPRTISDDTSGNDRGGDF